MEEFNFTPLLHLHFHVRSQFDRLPLGFSPDTTDDTQVKLVLSNGCMPRAELLLRWHRVGASHRRSWAGPSCGWDMSVLLQFSSLQRMGG